MRKRGIGCDDLDQTPIEHLDLPSARRGSPAAPFTGGAPRKQIHAPLVLLSHHQPPALLVT